MAMFDGNATMAPVATIKIKHTNCTSILIYPLRVVNDDINGGGAIGCNDASSTVYMMSSIGNLKFNSFPLIESVSIFFSYNPSKTHFF